HPAAAALITGLSQICSTNQSYEASPPLTAILFLPNPNPFFDIRCLNMTLHPFFFPGAASSCILFIPALAFCGASSSRTVGGSWRRARLLVHLLGCLLVLL
uniref:Uncharacterized protein n=1 Tax=Stegastes partitus TaxID=144197 RepID=A0A3B5AMT9_9TELE